MLFAEYVRIQSFLQIKRPRKSVGVLGPSDLKIFIRFGVIKGFLGLKVGLGFQVDSRTLQGRHVG